MVHFPAMFDDTGGYLSTNGGEGLPNRPRDWVGQGDLGVVCVLLDAQYLQRTAAVSGAKANIGEPC